jgi:flagellar FliL protein
MADKKSDESPSEEPGSKDAGPAKKASGKKGKKAKSKKGKGKLIMIIAIALVVVLGGGVTAFVMLSGSKPKEAKVNLPPPPGEITNYSFPKVLADLKTGQCKANYLSMRFFVEVGKNYTKAIQQKQPKIMEGIMLHLRSFERQDVVGREGDRRVKTDLTTIINRHIKLGKIEGIVFKEFILQ